MKENKKREGNKQNRKDKRIKSIYKLQKRIIRKKLRLHHDKRLYVTC